MNTMNDINNILTDQGFTTLVGGNPDNLNYTQGTLCLDSDGDNYIEVMVWDINCFSYTFRKNSLEVSSAVTLIKTVTKLLTKEELDDMIEKLKQFVEGE